MNKALILLLVGVFMAVGGLLFYSGGEEPASPQPAAQAPVAGTPSADPQEPTPLEGLPLPPMTEADRDTYANTIRTMNARNNELLRRLEEMDQRLKEKEQREINQQQVEQMVNRSVEERARNLTSTFAEKYQQIQSELSHKFQEQVNNLPSGVSTSGIPSGLGFDDSGDIKLPLGGKAGTGYPLAPTPQPQPQIVTILPVTLVGTTGGEQAPIPVAIDGTPLKSDPLLAEAQRMRDGKTEAVKIAPPVPVYTVPQNATLFSNDTLTALVGIVPNLQGSVVDPIRFKLITGNTNLATNGLYLPPGVKNIVWSGIAIGNREMSCVRGELHSVTFTFEDGTIRTVNSQADSGKSKLGGNLLGYISTQKGNPCLPGRLITNAQDYLMDRMWASGVAAAADGFSDTQTTTQRATDGTLTQYFSGNSGDYVASRTLAGSLTELTDYLRERQAQAIDLVFVESGQDVVVHVETQIEIDYDPQGRRLDHGNQVSTTDRLSYQLD
jgi:integrating conjugative element protein (TIGR03752 family)